jgi:hypothetical protein
MTMSESTTVPNVDLLEATMVHVETHPEAHSQLTWGKRTPCGTALCYAGHALELSGRVSAWKWMPLDNGSEEESLALVKLDGEVDWLNPDEAADRVLGVNGWLRAYALPGWRNLRVSLYSCFNTAADLRHIVEQLKREATS